MLNLFLLFHKCGNTYTKEVHARAPDTPFVHSIRPTEAGELSQHKPQGRVANVRCRNFSAENLMATGQLDVADSRFLVFTRHPASFVLSATKYHSRGGEEWVDKKQVPELGDRTLAAALNEAKNEADRQIAIMQCFEPIIRSMASQSRFFERPDFRRVRVEELFAQTEPSYFQELAAFLRLEKDKAFIAALIGSSLAQKRKLPDHSTGEFSRTEPYLALHPSAQEYYDEHYRDFQRRLGY